MKPFDKRKLKLISYDDLMTLLPQNNCIELAFKKSKNKKLFALRKFFVYHGDIVTDNISMGLDLFNPNELRSSCVEEPHIYPVILGNLIVQTAYFDGYVSGNVIANSLYSEYRLENIPIGCGGDLEVKELFLLYNRKVIVSGKAVVNTFIAKGKSEIISTNQQIEKVFKFPKKNRCDDFSLHSKEEIVAHFCNYAIDEIPRIEKYYGIDLNAMLPLYHSAGQSNVKYLK